MKIFFCKRLCDLDWGLSSLYILCW